MGTFLIFVGTFLLSMFVGMLAALSLLEAFPGLLFIGVLFFLPVFSFVAVVAFAIGYALASRARVLSWIAAGIALLVIALVVALSGIEGRPVATGAKNVQITLVLLLPAFVITLVQWGLVRRRFQRWHDEPQLSHWPWITTITGGFILLSPPAVTAIGAALTQARADWLMGHSLPVALLVIFIAVAAIVECAVRARKIRRQQLATT